MTSRVTVVGAGLAGCEAAWQLAQRGIAVTLVEMLSLIHILLAPVFLTEATDDKIVRGFNKDVA